MKKFRQLFADHFQEDERSMWFITPRENRKGLVEQMNDTRTRRQKSRDSIKYHLIRVPLAERVATELERFLLHQKGKRTYEHVWAPPGCILPRPFEKIVGIPYQYYTPREIRARKMCWGDWVLRPQYKFWTDDWYKPRRRIFVRQWKRMTVLYYQPKPAFRHWFRGYDLKVDRGYIDMSRKPYLYTWDDFTYKERVNSYLYDTMIRKWFDEVHGKRKYDWKHRRMYKYEHVNLRLYPAWTKGHINYIQKMFVKHDSHLEGHVDMDVVCELLDEFGDTTPREIRAGYFNHFALHHWFEEPSNKITFEEFLRILYSLTVPPRVPDPDPDPDAPVFKEKRDRQLGNHRRKEQFSNDISLSDYYERMFASLF